MKIKDLKGICYSSHGLVQMAVVWNYNTQQDIVEGSIEHIIAECGDLEIIRLMAHHGLIVLEVKV